MNIDQIYGEQKPFIERHMADFYNKFARDIKNDDRFTLSDDELSEMFNELLFINLSENMSDYELMRCYNNTRK